MLAVDKIAAAFKGIIEEVEKMDKENLSAEQKTAVDNIFMIAQ